MTTNFQGDPKIIVTPSGATLQFVGGQPLMDRGLENAVVILLFTQPAWEGNEFIRDLNQKIGSDFENAHVEPFTIDSFVNIEQAAKTACKPLLDTGVAKDVAAVTSNPEGKTISTLVSVQSPAGDISQILIEKHGVNWLAQFLDPAYEKVISQ